MGEDSTSPKGPVIIRNRVNIWVISIMTVELRCSMVVKSLIVVASEQADIAV